VHSPGCYRLYGLTLSSPISLPCPRVPSQPADVQLIAGTDAQFAAVRGQLTAAHTLDGWFWCKRIGDGGRYLKWDRLFEFLISPDGARISYRSLEAGTPESLTVYLLGPVLSFSLLALGIEPLHGTATVVGGEAVVFLGDCGMGKSTLAAALLARGLPMLTDDVVAVARRERRWLVQPGCPRVKLFPGVARRLLGTAAREPRMNHATSKLVLPLGTGQFIEDATPLRSIYVLSAPAGQRSTTAGVQVEPLSAREALLELVGAAFNLVVVDRQRLANQFTFTNELAATVPIRRLSYPRRFSSLPAVHDAVVADLATNAGWSGGRRSTADTATT
jgi:hypothetical protein